MQSDTKCADKPTKQMEAIDRDDPRYILGCQAAAAGVPLDMRQGHLHAIGWLEHRFREVHSFRKH
jgi:hypothetical protein